MRSNVAHALPHPAKSSQQHAIDNLEIDLFNADLRVGIVKILVVFMHTYLFPSVSAMFSAPHSVSLRDFQYVCRILALKECKLTLYPQCTCLLPVPFPGSFRSRPILLPNSSPILLLGGTKKMVSHLS